MKKIIPILILVFAFATTSYSQCSNPDAGEDFAICGSTTTISVENATTGYWTAMYTDNPCAINIHPDITETETNITISGFPSSHMLINVVWHDDSGPCTDTVQIEFVEIPEVYAGEDFDVCGTSTHLNASYCDSYGSWHDPFFPSPIENPDDPGTYVVSATYDAVTYVWQCFNQALTTWLECVDSDTVIVTYYKMPTANIITETNTTVYGLTFENLIAEYPGNEIIGYWVIDHPAAYFGDDFSYETSVTVPYYGSYEIYWHEESGPFSLSSECSDDSNPITIHFVDPIYSDIKINEKDDIIIFPNPITDVLNIVSESTIQSYQILDINGRIIKTGDGATSQLDLSDIAPGVYLMKFILTESINIVKFVKNQP